MGGVMNGMAAHRGIVPVGGTFFVFSDYMRGAVRLAALPTCTSSTRGPMTRSVSGRTVPPTSPSSTWPRMRAMPGLRVIRPADANETAQAWRIAVDSDGPTALILSRQDSPCWRHGRLAPEGVPRGAYVLRDPPSGPPGLVLIGTGSEVHSVWPPPTCWPPTASSARVVSFPSWELFAVQPDAYRDEVLPPGVPRLAVEAASSFGWERYADATVCLDRFGASAPGDVAIGSWASPPSTSPNGRRPSGPDPHGDHGLPARLPRQRRPTPSQPKGPP